MLNQVINIQDHYHKYLHDFRQQSADFTSKFVKVFLTCKYMLIQGLSTLGGLVLSIQRFHLWGLQLDIYHEKVQQYQWRYFHYTSLLAQQRPTSFKNTLLINLAFSQYCEQQMELYPLKYYYIKLWQSHAPSLKPW